MNNTEEMILLTWYKGSANSPWIVTLEDQEHQKHEVTIGDGGYAAAGPRLVEDIEYMDGNIHRYPMRYDMRQVQNKPARLFSARKLKDKITYLESPMAFGVELRSSYRQTPFTPLSEEVGYIKDGRYIESPKTENQIMATSGIAMINEAPKPEDNKATLLREYAPNSHIFWLFVHPQNVHINSSGNIEFYIDAYNWPQGYEVPQTVGSQNILDSQITVEADLLGIRSFSENASKNTTAAKRYNLIHRDENKKDNSQPGVYFSAAEKEAQEYLRDLIDNQGYLAVSLQYSTRTNQPVAHEQNLLTVVYGTDFQNLTEIRNSVVSGNFQGINLNKSLLKEYYSKNHEVAKVYPKAQDIPLVEYHNQSEGQPDHGINISQWVQDSGIQKAPLYDESLINDPYDSDSAESSDETIDRIVEEQVKKDIKEGRNRQEHYIHGYINNDLSFIPPNDDRVESGEIYNTVYKPFVVDEKEDAGALPYDYTHKVRIGDVLMEIPPLSIQTTKQQANETVTTLRSKNAMHKGVGATRNVLTLQLYFHDLENINGHKVHAYTKDNGEQIFYYMDGLRTLLAQFIKSPFVPIDNDYINDTLGVHDVAMRNIQASTVEGFPEALQVTLVLEEFDASAYLLGETSMGMLMNYPLYRWYYQKALQEPKTEFADHTYLPPIENLDNSFIFQIANESYLSERTDVIREFNGMRTPAEFKRELEEQVKQEETDGLNENQLHDKRAATNAFKMYEAFQDSYSKLPEGVRSQYKASELPIFTRPGEDGVNQKNGVIQPIEDTEEYQIGIEVGKDVYDSRFQSESINSLIYESATGDYSETKTRDSPLYKEESIVGIDNSIFIGTYQLPDYGIVNGMIKEYNVPGIFQLHITNKSYQNELNEMLDELRELGQEKGYEESDGPGGDPYSHVYYDEDVFFVPAGNIEGISFLEFIDRMANTGKDDVEEQVNDYTYQYNQMVDIINQPEGEIPTDEYYIEDFTPISMNVQIANNLSAVHTQGTKTPTFQYLGSQQPEIQLTFSTTDQGVKQIDELFRTIGRYAKEYRVGLVSNFLKVKNPLVNLFGINAVLPNTLDVRTVEGHPEQKIVSMVLSGFDKTQRKQEALYSFVGGEVSKELKDLHLDGYDPQVNSLYVHEKMKHMELYPDLELPFYSDLEADIKYLNAGVQQLENRTGQVYLDPDFYISTETTVRKELNEVLGDSRGTPTMFKDDMGYTGEVNAALNKNLHIEGGTQEDINEIAGDYTDPYFIWRGRDDNPESTAESEDDQVKQTASGIYTPSTRGDLIEGTVQPSQESKGYKKPTEDTQLKPGRSRQEVGLVRVIDGDTLVLTIDGQEETVRLIGVDAPEAKNDNTEGKRAKTYTEQRVNNHRSSLTVEYDRSQRDTYGRLLVYLWTGNEMLNEALLVQGYAEVMIVGANNRYAKEFRSAEKTAQLNGIGFWDEGVFNPGTKKKNELVPRNSEGLKNPDTENVWNFLWDELIRVFGDEPEFVNNDLTNEGIFTLNPVESDLSMGRISAPDSLEDGANQKELQRVVGSPFENYFYNLKYMESGDTLNYGLVNQIEEAHAEDENILDILLEGTVEGIRMFLFGLDNETALEDIESSTQEEKHTNPDGKSYSVPKLNMVRLFVYMRSLLDLESNWKQFDEDGQPLQRVPHKVGIMGAPINLSDSQSEISQVSLSWRKNISYSLNKMKSTYTKAKNNPYSDFHLRPLDWAILGHAGVELPDALDDPTKANDKPYTDKQLPIAPESIHYFKNFANYYERTTRSVENGNPLVLFSTPDGVLRDQMADHLGISEEQANEYIEEAFQLESNNFDQYTLEDKIKHMYVDMQQYDQTGRLVRAFPSYSLMLIDEGKWFQNFRTWDNFYGYHALHSIDVYRSRKIAADTAVITMSNMYGNLSSSHGTQSNPDLRLPSFFSSQFWEHFVLGLPTEGELEARGETYDQIMLQTGARVHLRMGYGADASYLPVVFNGSIAEMNTDEVIEIVAQSDAIELQNVISGDPEDDNVGFMNRVQEPRKTIGELMTAKGNWLREMINDTTNGTFFKDSPMGIVHFGSTIHSEEGNRAILPGAHNQEFGESLQNVYSQNGMETKSQWHNSDGSEKTIVDMGGEKVKELLSNISVVLGATPPTDEANIAVSYYGRTVWEIIQTFALASQDYIAAVVPFEFRSTLFFGKPHWMMQYRYDSDFIYDSDRETIDRTIRNVHQKTFMQAHVYNSYNNIISNNIIASEQGVYNNVIVTYDGRQAGPVQADSDIRFDKQRTVDVEANILAPRLFEFYRSEDQALIYGQSSLRDFMKDMYKGEYAVIGDPTVKPHDVVYLNDDINDMHGVHLVKAVHHSMDAENGFVSYIEPDAYVYNFDYELGELATGIFTVGKNLNLRLGSKAWVVGGGYLAGSALVYKLVRKAAGLAGTKIAGYASTAMNSRVAVGAGKRMTSGFYKTLGNLYNKGGATVRYAEQIRNAKTLTELRRYTSSAQTALKSDMGVAAGRAAADNAGFFSRMGQNFVDFTTNPKATKAFSGISTASRKTAGVVKGIVTSKTFLFMAVTSVIEIGTSWLGEWWQRKKQNAQAVVVVPLIYHGKRWTALMNWHKGSVYGDDPSLRDRLMHAQFGDGDEEVNQIIGNSLFKFLNLFTEE